ncbi:hypothetical protein HNQ85_000235 [Anoxybacillus calidus]|uniref:Uncharacterized protein n=1 Tax=[Anoxybacillus] calidus TaxID=575178 RepID=A0A7V9YWY9_9BACL|nr:hypothetical protein [Anoxybacillus calidus]MBA2869977.1 hypothetical protein [Anoxybacillus calidus]
MRKIKIAYYYEDRPSNRPVIEYCEGFLITDNLALSIADGKVAILERVKPSETFRGCYEPDDGDYMQFNLTEDVYNHIMRNYENMTEIELLNIVANGVRVA